MRETSYHAVIAEMTVRALWELQNLLDCIPDALWDRCYGGAPLWQHVYHTLHELDQWFINPRDTDFVEPPIHTPHLQELHIYPAVRLDRQAVDDYFYTIKAKLSIYLTSLHDEDRSKRGFSQERMAEYLDISIGEYKLIESYGHIPKTGYFLLICWKLRLNPLCYLKQALQQEERDVSVLGEEAETA